MEAIAQKNSFFARTYDQSQRELADIRLRELAFTELAYRLGEKLGMSTADVHKAGTRLRIDVLKNNLPAARRTNSNVSPVLRKYGPSLLQEIEGRRIEFLKAYKNAIDIGQIYKLIDSEPEDWRSAFLVFENLARQGNVEAYVNLGHCFAYALGTEKNVDEATKYYIAALHANDFIAPGKLFNLYVWEESGIYNLEKAEQYLKIAEQKKLPYAAKFRQRFEEKRSKEIWTVEEPRLLEKLLTIVPGTRPAELEAIKGRGYFWERVVTFFHECEYKVYSGETVNKGTLFSPKKFTDCYIEISNDSDEQFVCTPTLELDMKKYNLSPSNLSGKGAAVRPKSVTRLILGQYPVKAMSNTVKIRLYHQSYKSLGRFGTLCPRAADGYLELRLAFERPIVI